MEASEGSCDVTAPSTGKGWMSARKQGLFFINEPSLILNPSNFEPRNGEKLESYKPERKEKMTQAHTITYHRLFSLSHHQK